MKGTPTARHMRHAAMHADRLRRDPDKIRRGSIEVLGREVKPTGMEAVCSWGQPIALVLYKLL